MKGKIAVIDSCFRCPYKAFDNRMGLAFSPNGPTEHFSSEVAYCGYHIIGFDGSQIRIEDYLNLGNCESIQPDNCPLPYGNDKRNLKKGKWFHYKWIGFKVWLNETKCKVFGHVKGELDFGHSYNCTRCYHSFPKSSTGH